MLAVNNHKKHTYTTTSPACRGEHQTPGEFSVFPPELGTGDRKKEKVLFGERHTTINQPLKMIDNEGKGRGLESSRNTLFYKDHYCGGGRDRRVRCSSVRGLGHDDTFGIIDDIDGRKRLALRGCELGSLLKDQGTRERGDGL